MSKGAPTKVFLQRAGYQQRRLRDAAKLVPFLGLVLLTIPLSWQAETVGAAGVVYIFGVWLALIGLSAILSSRIQFDTPDSDGDTAEK